MITIKELIIFKKDKNGYQKKKNYYSDKKEERKHDPICGICKKEHDYRECLKKRENYSFCGTETI